MTRCGYQVWTLPAVTQPLTAAINYLAASERLLKRGSSDSATTVREAIGHTREQLRLAGDIMRRAKDLVSARAEYAAEVPVGAVVDDVFALVRLTPPGAKSRTQAARHFAEEIARLSRSIGKPATLIIAGGETLKAQCLAVQARALRVLGRLEPGVPKSVIQGGAWAGVDVISKSGAFGPSGLWRNLLSENSLI